MSGDLVYSESWNLGIPVKVNATRPVIFLMGPTASGKTSVAVDMFKRLPVEIVSVDSAMVYRGMDIGTAKPGPDILRIAPHHLIDICDPAQVYSAGKFRDDALEVIRAIHKRNKIPLLVGGTGLYFRSLEQGISELPEANPAIRGRLESEAGEIGWQMMHARLASIDPESAGRIHPNDPQRIQRALEVYEISGKPLSSFFSEGRQTALPYPLKKIIISPADRQVIHKRVKRRFMEMIELGLVEEVRGLYRREDIDASLPAMRMVGYRQVWRYLEGLINRQQMLEHAIVATRQLAKRQLTWLRAESNSHWFDSTNVQLLDKILKFLKEDSNLFVRV